MSNSYRAEYSELAESLARVGREFYSRGWAMGTSGNFSAVVSRDPLRLAITSSGIDKGSLSASNILEVDSEGLAIGGKSRPSDETLLHITVARARGAGAVLHTHSVWSTLLSEEFAADRGLAIEGYEMLKGLDGVRTHEHREWLPILDNSQDMRGLARVVERTLAEHPGSHAFLLRGHGLYTWGRDLPEAKRHVEILEFLMEVIGRAGKIRS